MPDIVKTRYLKDKRAHSCEIHVQKDGEDLLLAECGAVVKATEKSTILHTDKYKYPVIEREYSVVICNINRFNFEPALDFLRNVERYDLKLTFVTDGRADRDITITDAQPKRIDLTGEWEFFLTDAEGEKIRSIYT